MIKKQKLSKNKKRGFSLVEVIVSMALTVIISLIAFAVCNACINIGGKNNIKNFFMSESKNYISAYFAGNSDYADAMTLLTGENYVYGEDATLYYSSDFKISGEADARYKVNLIFGDKFVVECLNLDNTEIYQIEV